MFCKNCGTQLKDGAAFCTNCGVKIVPVGQEVYELPTGTKKSLQIPVIIAAFLIVAVIGCLGAVLLLKGRDSDEDVAAQDIISEEDDSEEEVNEEPVEEQELADEAAKENGEQEIQAIEEPAEEENQYVLPNSDSAYLSLSDLTGLTKEECRLARNELYARHGRKFDDEGLQEYFNEKDWYQGYIEPSDFSDSVLNEFEMANRDLIVRYEEEMGYR